MSQLSYCPPGEPTVVAVGVVGHQGRYLIGQRPDDAALAGYWEFPGGKCRPGEPPEACVVRECREETGLEVRVLRLRQELTHVYSQDAVRLFFFDCALAASSPPGLEPPAPRPPFRWVRSAELNQYRFPEANAPVLRELTEASRPNAH